MNESTLDMMQLDRQLEALKIQIYAYQKAKELDHYPLMEHNLNAIKMLCKSVEFRLASEERRENNG
jgi:hypothetical protein